MNDSRIERHVLGQLSTKSFRRRSLLGTVTLLFRGVNRTLKISPGGGVTLCRLRYTRAERRQASAWRGINPPTTAAATEDAGVSRGGRRPQKLYTSNTSKSSMSTAPGRLNSCVPYHT